MHRTWLLNKLRIYKPYTNAERESLARMLTLVESHSNCFERGHLPGHITGSAWIVSPDGREILLTHHKKLNMWLQLGGHSDGDPHTLNVALREAHEESGISGILPVFEDIFDLDVHPIPASLKEPAHDHYDVRFLLRAPLSRDFQVSDESHDLAWVGLESLSRYTKEVSMLRMAEKHRLWHNQ